MSGRRRVHDGTGVPRFTDLWYKHSEDSRTFWSHQHGLSLTRLNPVH